MFELIRGVVGGLGLPFVLGFGILIGFTVGIVVGRHISQWDN